MILVVTKPSSASPITDALASLSRAGIHYIMSNAGEYGENKDLSPHADIPRQDRMIVQQEKMINSQDISCERKKLNPGKNIWMF